MFWIPILSAIFSALGGFFGVWLNLKSEKNKHLFDHKMSVYLSLIKSYRNAVIHNNDKKYQQEYVSSQEQVELIGSEEVVSISKEFYEEGSSKKSPQIQQRLIKAMRKDLYSNRKF